MFIKDKYDTDYTDVVKTVYKLISDRFGYTAKITNIWPLLSAAFNVKEFEILDLDNYNNGSFEAYMIDRMIDWRNGKRVNFSEIYDEILELGDFTETEKLEFSCGKFEEVLWAIYLAVVDPAMNI